MEFSWQDFCAIIGEYILLWTAVSIGDKMYNLNMLTWWAK